MMMRAFIIAPAQMKAYPIRRNVCYRTIDGCDMELHDFLEFRGGGLGKPSMAANGQIGAIKLQDETCPVNSLVFFLHHVRENLKIFLVGRVEFVFEKQRDNSGRRCRHERFTRMLPDQSGFKTANVLLKRLFIPPSNRTAAGGRFQGHHGFRFHYEALNKFGKIAKVTGRWERTFSVETHETVFDVGHIADLAHFAVVNDVNPRFYLLAYDFLRRVCGHIFELSDIYRSTTVCCLQKIEK